MKAQVEPQLETELTNILHNMCPAINWDEQFQAYGCIYDGRKCTFKDRDKCETYVREYRMRRVL